MSRALQLQRSGIHAVDFLNKSIGTYGMEDDGLLPSAADEVVVPTTTFTLSEEQLSLLQQTVDPLSDSANHGIDLYLDTLHLIRVLLSCN